MKLSVKLSLIVFFVTLACGAATSLLVSVYSSRMLQQRMLDDVEVVVKAVAPHLTDAVLYEDPVTSREILQGLVSEPKGLAFAYLLDDRGEVVAHTFDDRPPGGLPGTAAGDAGRRGERGFLPFDGGETAYLVGNYPLFEGAALGSVHVGIDRAVFESQTRPISVLVLSLCLSISVVGIVAAMLAADRMTRPLSALARSISSFGRGTKSFPPMETGGAEVLQLSAAFHEMVEARTEAEKILGFQEALLKAQSETGIDGILTISPEGKVLYHNRRFLEMWSIPEGVDTSSDATLLSSVLDRLADPDGFVEKVRYLYAHPDENIMDEIPFKDGRVFERYSSFLTDAAGRSYGRIWFFRDITSRRRAEEERLDLERRILHVQKLESLGVLAGGIAHDFNNILFAILGNAELALAWIDKESRAVENIRRIEKAAAKASDLAQQMLAYSGKGTFRLEHINLNRLLEEMLHLIEVSISKSAELSIRLDGTIPSVEADPTQIRQVVMNLVINASEAIGEKSGVITIATGQAECDKAFLKEFWSDGNLEEGRYVLLEVSDTGCGMDRETMDRIYEPFFSTKFAGRGLGMSAVLGIVRSHKGAIRVASQPGRGSTFKVLLPASDGPPEVPDAEGADVGWRGKGTVLVVDDEEAVRTTECEMLGNLGFAVVAAEDGGRALELFGTGKDIDLVLLDLTMPRMGGEECFRALRARDPGAKVILASGYSVQEVALRFAGKGLSGFLQKPFAMESLRAVLMKVLSPGTAEGDREKG